MENFTENQGGGVSPQQQGIKGVLKKRILASPILEKSYHFKIGRKLVHVSFSTLGFAYLFTPTSFDVFIALLIYGLTITAFVIDSIRIFTPSFNRFIHKYFGMLFIRRDLYRYSSGTYYLIGATIVSLLFPYRIAGMSIVFLGIGDFMASLGGTYLKKILPLKLPKTHKTVIGLIFFIVPTTLIGYFAHIPILACFIASLAAGLAEVYLVRIDDNLSIPIVGSIVLFLLLGHSI